MKIVKIYYAVVVKNVTQLPTVTLHKKIKFSIGDFFSECDQIHSFLGTFGHIYWRNLQLKSWFYVKC